MLLGVALTNSFGKHSDNLVSLGRMLSMLESHLLVFATADDSRSELPLHECPLYMLVTGYALLHQKESCGVAAVNAILGRKTVSYTSLFKLQATLGLDSQIFEEKGVCILVLLAVLARHGFMQDISHSHRDRAGFCGAAVAGVSVYLLGDGHHWTVLKREGSAKWVLHDNGEELPVCDCSEYIQGFVRNSPSHWVMPITGTAHHELKGSVPVCDASRCIQGFTQKQGQWVIQVASVVHQESDVLLWYCGPLLFGLTGEVTNCS